MKGSHAVWICKRPGLLGSTYLAGRDETDEDEGIVCGPAIEFVKKVADLRAIVRSVRILGELA